MLVKSRCNHCGAVIEADHQDLNREMECPHCHRQTFVNMTSKNFSPREGPREGFFGTWLKVGIAIIALLAAAAACVIFGGLIIYIGLPIIIAVTLIFIAVQLVKLNKSKQR